MTLDLNLFTGYFENKAFWAHNIVHTFIMTKELVWYQVIISHIMLDPSQSNYNCQIFVNGYFEFWIFSCHKGRKIWFDLKITPHITSLHDTNIYVLARLCHYSGLCLTPQVSSQWPVPVESMNDRTTGTMFITIDFTNPDLWYTRSSSVPMELVTLQHNVQDCVTTVEQIVTWLPSNINLKFLTKTLKVLCQ